MKVLRRQAENFLDCPNHADSRVALRHELPLLDVRTANQSNAAMGVDVVGSVLRIVLDGEDECRFRVRAVRYLVDDEPDRVIVVSYLQFRRVDAEYRLREHPGVVVHQPEQGEIGQLVVLDERIEFTRPLDIAEEIRKLVVKAPEVRIGAVQQRLMRRKGNSGPGPERILQRWDITRRDRRKIADGIAVEAVVAHAEVRPDRCVPQIAFTLLSRRILFHFFLLSPTCDLYQPFAWTIDVFLVPWAR